MNNSPIIKEVVLNASVEKVWKAITDKGEMKNWYFDIAEFKPEVGFTFQFYGGDEKNQWLHLCTITEAVPGKKLSYSWRYEGYPGESFVTFEVIEEGEKTRVKLTHAGLESFGTDLPWLAKENFNEGWEEILNTSLKKYLEQ